MEWDRVWCPAKLHIWPLSFGIPQRSHRSCSFRDSNGKNKHRIIMTVSEQPLVNIAANYRFYYWKWHNISHQSLRPKHSCSALLLAEQAQSSKAAKGIISFSTILKLILTRKLRQLTSQIQLSLSIYLEMFKISHKNYFAILPEILKWFYSFKTVQKYAHMFKMFAFFFQNLMMRQFIY